MSGLGAPQTEKFEIGTAEVRVGPLTSAMKLTPANSIGLLDKVMVEATVETAQLEGGFPRRRVAEAIIREACTLTATCREYSRRNIRLALGYGVEAVPPTDLSQAVTVAVAPVALTDGGKFTVASAAGFTDGIVVALYPVGAPELVTLSKVQGTPALNVITLDVDFPVVVAPGYSATDYVIVAAREVALGGNSGISYFTLMAIEQDFSTGRPKVFVIWKASVSNGLRWDSNATDFSATDLVFSAIMPAESDLAVGGPLEAVAGLVADNPYGMFVQGGDE